MPLRIALMSAVVLMAAACASPSASSGSGGVPPEVEARFDRREERREARERDERRERRQEDRRQRELSNAQADLPVEAAVFVPEEIPAEFPATYTTTGEGFEAQIGESPVAAPPLCADARTILVRYATLPAEDVAGTAVISPELSVYFVHVVARLDEVDAIWDDFVTKLEACLRSLDLTAEGTVGVALERLPSVRAGRALGVGYRQVVTLPDVAATLYERYLVHNGRCISDITVAARPVEPGQYRIPDALIQASAERLNRLQGCDLPASD